MVKNDKGFTLVELLIVIVIIAILAAITIVAYNGMQDRARYSVMKSDLGSIQQAVELYHAENGSYPSSGASGVLTTTTAGSSGTLNIPGLVPTYIGKIPSIPNDGHGGYYAYITNGTTDYKLLRLATTAANLPSVEKSDPDPDPNVSRAGRGWGLWTPGGANY